MFNNKDKGIILAIITAVISGVSVFVNKFAVSSMESPLQFVSIKNFAVSLLTLSLLISTKKLKKIRKLSRREIKYLVLIGVVGGFLPFFLFFKGLSLIPAVNAAIIHKSLVIWVTMLAIPLLKEKVSKTQFIAVLFILTGNLFVGGFNGFEFSRGELMVLAATVLWAVENIFAKKVLSSVEPDLVVLFRMGLGSLLLVGTNFFLTPTSGSMDLTINPEQIFWIGLTVITLFGYVTSWYRALKLTPAITVASILSISTLITNILSAIFITHKWSGGLLIQSSLFLSGVALFLISEKLAIKENSSIL